MPGSGRTALVIHGRQLFNDFLTGFLRGARFEVTPYLNPEEAQRNIGNKSFTHLFLQASTRGAQGAEALAGSPINTRAFLEALRAADQLPEKVVIMANTSQMTEEDFRDSVGPETELTVVQGTALYDESVFHKLLQ